MIENINYIIESIKTDGQFRVSQDNIDEYRESIKLLKAKNIIANRDGGGYIFTDIGYHVSDIGYENYINELKENKKIQDKLNESAFKSADATVDSAQSAKSSKRWGIFTSLVGLASFLWAIYQTSEVDSLKKDVQKSDSLRILQGQIIEKQNQRLSKIEQTLNRLQSKK